MLFPFQSYRMFIVLTKCSKQISRRRSMDLILPFFVKRSTHIIKNISITKSATYFSYDKDNLSSIVPASNMLNDVYYIGLNH